MNSTITINSIITIMNSIITIINSTNTINSTITNKTIAYILHIIPNALNHTEGYSKACMYIVRTHVDAVYTIIHGMTTYAVTAAILL